MCTEQAFSFSYPIKNGYDNYFLIFSLNGVHLLGTHGKKKIRVVPSEKKAVGLRGKYTIEVGHLVNTYTDGETALQLFLGQPVEKQDKEFKRMINNIILKIGHTAGINAKEDNIFAFDY